ncbi:MAG: ABC transporter ATP-binding protein [Firmicutes bacterium]|nr:ABC transporter ATP-binding protein [Bacillota bacterium]
MTLLGPSGCGKTTLLRCVAGLETPDSGKITLGHTVVWAKKNGKTTVVTPDKRGLSMVFQTYAIWPHMTVFENVAYPLEAQGMSKAEITSQVAKTLKFVQLEGFERRPVTALSGGQQQRVALARAIAPEPQIILLDEPLSNLDAKLREETRVVLRSSLNKLGVTALYVTHDRLEAFALSDVVVVMKDGKIMQQGSPEDVYFRPNSRFIVDFIGKANFINGSVQEVKKEHILVDTGLGTLLCQFRDDVQPKQRSTVAIRTDFVEVVPKGKENNVAEELTQNLVSGVVERALFLGEYREVNVRVAEETLTFRLHPTISVDEGDQVQLFLNPQGCHFLL